jgi:hypothetical protein
MSRKQEIYREVLFWALPTLRNCLSRYTTRFPKIFLRRSERGQLKASFEIAEFIHNIYASILVEDFTDHDMYFINQQARNFIQNCDPNAGHYALFAFYIQQLINEVPPNRKKQLTWMGPQQDYSWARPIAAFTQVCYKVDGSSPDRACGDNELTL